MLNVTEVKFNGAKGDSSALYQYDYGQILTFPDLILPEAYEVHFARQSDAQTITMIGTADGVAVPDEMLLSAGHIKVYIYLHEGETDGETEYKAIIPVIARPEPSDIEPTPVQQDVITQAIAALNTAVDEAEGYAQDAQEAAESIPEHVLVYDEQTLTDAEKAQARANIGAANANYEIRNLADGSYNHSIRMTSSAPESDYAEGHLGGYASAFGFNTKASGGASHAEGWSTEASNTASHSEGRDTEASGQAAHAEGLRSVASASQAHAEGRDTVASGTISHAQGEGTIANHRAQTVAGQFNIADPASGAETERGTYVEIIGNGVDANTRSNARTLDWSGNEKIAGKMTVGANAVNPMDVPTLAQVQGMIPTVPTDVSAFNNDAGYQTASDLNSAILASLITDTASGDPCAIPDGASAPVVDCKVSIVPKQSGSGTPSPSNVRPISGWTEMTMRRTGMNVFDLASAFDDLGVTYTVDSDGWFTVENLGSPNLYSNHMPMPYTVTNGSVVMELHSDTTATNFRVRVYSGSTAVAQGTKIENKTFDNIGFDWGNIGKVKFKLMVVNAKTVGDVCYPYEAQTYTKSWTPTVYGGTLDLTTGVLTVEYKAVDMGSINWLQTTLNGANAFYYQMTDAKKPTSNGTAYLPNVKFVCSVFEKISADALYSQPSGENIISLNTNAYFQIRDPRYSTVADFKTAMSGQTICYELAEPTTIQLTPTEVQTILGSNTFSADTGAVTVEYRADTELWVEGHVPSKTSQLTNDSGFITASNAPVRSVNGKTGAVTIANATTSASGLMSATDKANLDTLMDDYTSAMTALGV